MIRLGLTVLATVCIVMLVMMMMMMTMVTSAFLGRRSHRLKPIVTNSHVSLSCEPSTHLGLTNSLIESGVGWGVTH